MVQRVGQPQGVPQSTKTHKAAQKVPKPLRDLITKVSETAHEILGAGIHIYSSKAPSGTRHIDKTAQRHLKS